MHAEKVSRSNAVTFIPPAHNTLAARLQGKRATHKTGDLSPLLGRQWARQSGVQASGLQAKGQDNPAAAFSGSGHSIPSQQKYSQLLGKDLSNVRLHTGPQVDAVLLNNGLQGLTDGSGHIAVASTAESGTLEHEIVHIGQPTVTEGNRAALETHADTQARNIMSGKAVEAFGGGNLQRNVSGRLQGSRLQGKCNKCTDEEHSAKTIQNSTHQAKPEHNGHKQNTENEQGSTMEERTRAVQDCISKQMANRGFAGYLEDRLRFCWLVFWDYEAQEQCRNHREAVLNAWKDADMAAAFAECDGEHGSNWIGHAVVAIQDFTDELIDSGKEWSEIQREIQQRADQIIVDEITRCIETGGDPLTCSSPGVM